MDISWHQPAPHGDLVIGTGSKLANNEHSCEKELQERKGIIFCSVHAEKKRNTHNQMEIQCTFFQCHLAIQI